MTSNATKTTLRNFLADCLADARDDQPFADDSSLFLTGRLDSLTMTRLILFLEDSFDIDFGKLGFDVELIDSVDAAAALVDGNQLRRA